MIEYKTLKFKLDTLEEDGIFTGYAAVYGVEDLGGDMIDKGCFKRSIDHKSGQFPILAAHDVTKEIGIAVLEEDDKGIHVRQGRLYLNTTDPRNEIPDARYAYIRMKQRQDAGMPMGMSIGYETLEAQFSGGVRHLKQAKLYEVSTDVVFPMNPLAGVTTVKTLPVQSGDTMRLPSSTKNGQDFAQTFAQVRAHEDLQEERWDINSAFWESIYSILCAEDMTQLDKIALLRTSLTQFGDALLTWATTYLVATIPAMMTTLAADHLRLSTTAYLFDVFQVTTAGSKAGAVLSAANRVLLETALTHLQALLSAATPEITPTKSHVLPEPMPPPAPAPVDSPASGDSHAATAETTEEDAALLQALLDALPLSTGSPA
jgi:HK97 family phage prohead protease